MKDYLVRGIVDSKNVRVFAIHSTNLVEEARIKHDMWPTSIAALGRMMSVTLMMGAMLKQEEKISCTINGGGPIGTLVTTTRGDGRVKGFVADPHVYLTYNDSTKLAVGPSVGKDGYLEVIRDMALKDTFSGRVPLTSGEIADDFTYYFAASEQTPSVVSLGVLVEPSGEVSAAGGFIIQLLPNATEEDIEYIENQLNGFPQVSSLIKEGKTPEEILQMIFDDVELFDTQDVCFSCDCSKEGMEQALSTLPTSDLEEMINEDHGCEITCHFCNTHYQFTEEELQSIIDRRK